MQSLISPVIVDSSMLVKCPDCAKIFQTSQALRRHQNRKYPCRYYRYEQIDDRYLCIHCYESFSSSRTVMKHLKSCQALIDQIRADSEANNLPVPPPEEEKPTGPRKSSQEVYQEAIRAHTNIGKQTNVNSHNTQNIQNNTTNTTNNNTQNIQNNIKIVLRPFGRENMEFIDTKAIRQAIRKGLHAPAHLMEYIHYHKDHPENHNILMPSLKSKTIETFNGNKWTIHNAQQILEDSLEEMVEQLEDVGNELKPNQIGYQAWQELQKLMKKGDTDFLVKRMTEYLVSNNYIGKLMKKKFLENQKKKIQEQLDSIDFSMADEQVE